MPGKRMTCKDAPLFAATFATTLATAFLLATAFSFSGGGVGEARAAGQTLTPSCPPSLVAGGHDYHGLNLVMCNFSGMDLSNANFKGATLTAVVFIRANLQGADFSGATILDSQNPVLPTDFSLANLTRATFEKAVFNGPTYLTYATLTCADFSRTNINNGNAIFGDSLLIIDAAQSCRTKFTGAVMNCEFVAQWDQMDLTSASIDACVGQLETVAGQQGHDFSGGIYANVVFDGLDLSSSKWTGAVLERASFQGATLDGATGLNGTVAEPSRLSGARFNNASVQNVDLGNAQLYGANFTHANLSNSSLAGSFLTANTSANPPIETAASFDGAHLRDVNLANADLAGASFRFASLYGSFGGATPSAQCSTNVARCTSPSRFTCACATASGANLTETNFGSAFLFGIDFSGATTTINGTSFSSAILVGANFSNASFQVSGGAAPDFTKAMLQGTRFDSSANLLNASLLGGFVDFGIENQSPGNALFLQLSADYTRFRGWAGASAPCVQTLYESYTAVPSTIALTCPDGSSGVCGSNKPAPNPNPRWAGGIPMKSNSPVPGWYWQGATYESGGSQACGNNVPVDPRW